MPVSDSDLNQRILGAFCEMPGMCATIPQAARALERLERAGVLRQTAQGSYLRAPGECPPRPARGFAG